MPHTPDTHITITPEHVYINGEPVSVESDSLKVSAPTPTDIQTVTLTIYPTTVTILNEDNEATTLYERPETPTHRWLTNHTRDEAVDNHSTFIHAKYFADMLDTWKQYEATRAKHTHETHKKPTLTTVKQHEWLNEVLNRR